MRNPFLSYRLGAVAMPGLPQSLRSQFMLGIAALSLLIVAIGMAAVYALRNGSDAAQRLALQHLEHAQQLQQAGPAGTPQQAADHEHAYREALQALVEHSTGNQRGIVLLLVIALLFTWMVASLFLGRHLLLRLQQVSLHLRSDTTACTPLAELTEGGDEIAEMARAVHHLLADRAALQARTAELFRAQESLTAQGRILEMMAHHDALTGLPNRALLNDRLAQALAQARRSGRPLGLLFLDLDGFKDINDSLGHATGDRLLRSVADRLRTLVREGDTVARLGGDEFVVMLVNLTQAGDAPAVAHAIAQALAQPHPVDGHTLHVTASVGVAAFPDDGDSAEALLKHADAAMYRAKAQGRNVVQCCTHDMSVRARPRVALQSSLHVPQCACSS